MQLIARYAIDSYAVFRSAFDADAEDRGLNGLSLLQLWREGDRGAWALYQVGDAKAAHAYLSGGAGAFNAQAGVSETEFHFVETA